eukprot:m.658221 g.658221  ORF g.658221 m.658221 type:complete len:71 (-) comp22716_c0_seq53:3303-3515(-)
MLRGDGLSLMSDMTSQRRPERGCNTSTLSPHGDMEAEDKSHESQWMRHPLYPAVTHRSKFIFEPTPPVRS